MRESRPVPEGVGRRGQQLTGERTARARSTISASCARSRGAYSRSSPAPHRWTPRSGRPWPARMIKSTDGGATWASRDLAPLATTLVDVYFTSATDGLAVGSIGAFPYESRAVVLQTADGGDTWQQRYLGNRLEEWGWKIS